MKMSLLQDAKEICTMALEDFSERKKSRSLSFWRDFISAIVLLKDESMLEQVLPRLL